MKLTSAFLIAFALSLAPPAGAQYKQTNLVSDLPGMASITDPLLINPWGMSSSATSPLWVSNAGSMTSTLYSIDGTTGTVAKAPLIVSIGAPPSGQVFNGSANFGIPAAAGGTVPALFIFAGLNGTLSGWNPASTGGMNNAVMLITGAAPASYTGLAMGMRGTDPFLYAADPAGARIDVYDKNFAPITLPGSPFADPSLPAGNVPFNVANIGGNLFVAYSGPSGIVNVFTTDGVFVKRFTTGGTVRNPWGMAMSPSNFGMFSNALLIGNFNGGNAANGPGNVSAFDPGSGAFLGLLKDDHGNNVAIDGLWTLKFGNGGNGGIPNVLYFSAGIQGEAHGLVGSLSVCSPVLSGVSATPNVLWPPNHKFVPVTVDYTVNDACVPAPTCTLSVTSNEPDSSPEWMIVDPHHVDLLAERSGNGSGRIYTITVQCSDQSAQTSVTVPHDQGH